MIYATYDPRNSLSDMKAFLDSYAVDLTINGKIYFRAPVMFCNTGPRPIEPLTKDSQLFPKINGAMNLRLIPYEPFREEEQTVYTRWPFFVDAPFSVMFCCSDQFWQYDFTPEKMYEERSI